MQVHRRMLSRLMRYLDDMGFYTYEKCGIHVHIERRAEFWNNFTWQSRALFTLLNCSTPEWDAFTEFVYGRDGADYAAAYSGFRDYSVSENEKRGPLAGKDPEWVRQLYSLGKYYRVNFQHSDTIEFRQGDGTVYEGKILTYAECSLALMDFATEKKNLRHLPEKEVAAFVASVTESQYPNLHAFLDKVTRRGLCCW